MTVHDIIPFAQDKNLGAAYNKAMALIPDGDWACFRDGDTMYLTADYGNILHEYATRFPKAGILTCLTNRISTLSQGQLLNGTVSNDSDIKNHIKLAEEQKKLLYQVKPIERVISGFLMMVSKDTWNEVKFVEDRKCLVVDNLFSKHVMRSGRQILSMQGLYIWHTYRLITGIYDKNHLL